MSFMRESSPMLTATTTKTIPTLKGIFTKQKMPQRRNFLRENKLSVKDMQRANQNKQITQKEEQREKQQKQLQQHQQKQQKYLSRRVTPQIRGQASLGDAEQQTSVMDLPVSAVRCPSCSGRMRNGLAQIESNHKGVQTEAIYDEEFLYTALKRCASTELKAILKNIERPPTDEPDERQQQFKSYEQSYNKQKIGLQSSPQSSAEDVRHNNASMDLPKQSHFSNGQTQMDDMHLKFKQMDMGAPHKRQYLDELPQQQQDNYARQRGVAASLASGRSQQTSCSQDTQERMKHNNAPHKLGSRDDIRLPRYLEREKREKENQRMREASRDPNCPPGHFLLPDEERLAALHNAERNFRILIDELNSMPMTSETLRVRARKVEIEKELTAIEDQIRIFSKHKVYVKQY